MKRRGHLGEALMSDLSDATLAQLMAMGFDPDQIRACHAALSAQNTPLTIQSATEWYVSRRS